MEAIANWIWQGGVVVIAAAAMLRTRRISAATRYRAWWIALAIVLIIPLAPLMTPTAPISQPLVVDASSNPYAIVLQGRSWWAPSLVIAFAVAWCAAHVWRTLSAFAALRRAKRACYQFPEERAIALRGWRARRSAGRSARLVLSNDVSSAAVLGLTSPAIAVSPALLRGLSDEELDAIVVHEWAHVQRRDDWARLAQVIVRAVAGFHPAVWWIDRQLHLERETACDDWAIGLTGSPRAYAACLTKVAALRVGISEPVLVPSALTTSDLAKRVVRLLDARRSTSTRPRFATTALVAPLLAVTAFAVAGIELIVFATPSRVAAPKPREIPPIAPAIREAPPHATVAVDEPRPAARGRRASQRSTVIPGASAGDTQSAQDRSSAALEVRSPAAEPSASIPPLATQAPAVNAVDVLRSIPSLPAAAAPRDPSAPESASPPAGEPTPWGVATDAGVGIARGSQKTATATAGFFTRLGKSIARSF